MPRDVPGKISITPFRARAFKCSSAALADLKPNSRAISARVGGIPVFNIVFLISSSTSSCRAVSGRITSLFFYTVTLLYTVNVKSQICFMLTVEWFNKIRSN